MVTWPTSTRAKFPALASRISSKLQARTCATVPGALSIASSHMVWIESITTRVVSLGLLQAGGDVADIDRGGEFDRGNRRRPGGGRAGGSDRSTSSPETYSTRRPERARRGGRLQQQGGFADAGIAADQHRRGRNQAAAQHAVEFGDADGRARRRFGAAGQANEGDACAASRRLGGGPGRAVTASSSTVFHSPQASQRPAHFGVTAPHD